MSVTSKKSSIRLGSQQQIASNCAVSATNKDSQLRMCGLPKFERNIVKKSAQEEHWGWLENVRAEKRTMIMSLQRSLQLEKTYNRDAAQRMLDLEIASVTSKEYNPERIPLKPARGLRNSL